MRAHRADGYSPVSLAPQGALAVVRRSLGRGGDGEGLAVRGRGHDGVPLAPPQAVATAPDKLKGIVEADETYVLASRKGERKLEVRRRGGKAGKRGLSREQVPVAADRSGATASTVLPAADASALTEAPGRRRGCPPGIGRPQGLPGLRCRSRCPPRGSRPFRRRARPGHHTDGEQPAQSTEGLPAPVSRSRNQVPQELPEVVPSHRAGQRGLPASLPRRRDGRLKHT